MIKSITIKVNEEENVELEMNDHILRFYKKETNRKKVTRKGLINFFSNFVRKMNVFL